MATTTKSFQRFPVKAWNMIAGAFGVTKPLEFDSLIGEAVLTARWRQEYNRVRPHMSLGYRSPAPEAINPLQVING